MSTYVKIDERAFNRGVNEVLKLKPITRMVREVVLGEHGLSKQKRNHPAAQELHHNEGRRFDKKPSRKTS